MSLCIFARLKRNNTLTSYFRLGFFGNSVEGADTGESSVDIILNWDGNSESRSTSVGVNVGVKVDTDAAIGSSNNNGGSNIGQPHLEKEQPKYQQQGMISPGFTPFHPHLMHSMYASYGHPQFGMNPSPHGQGLTHYPYPVPYGYPPYSIPGNRQSRSYKVEFKIWLISSSINTAHPHMERFQHQMHMPPYPYPPHGGVGSDGNMTSTGMPPYGIQVLFYLQLFLLIFKNIETLSRFKLILF